MHFKLVFCGADQQQAGAYTLGKITLFTPGYQLVSSPQKAASE